uniref:Uncharacterized protein n=1 Tax=Rhizobium meliloti TaxID=382 RepID=I2E1B2_RHIML|nr:hypothetical protein pHRC017_0071 [Sinorhizobium meliloti]
MSRSQMTKVGLFPLPGQLSASALIADGGPDIGMAGPTEASKVCRSRAKP